MLGVSTGADTKANTIGWLAPSLQSLPLRMARALLPCGQLVVRNCEHGRCGC